MSVIKKKVGRMVTSGSTMSANILHFETDTDAVLVGSTDETLSTKLSSLDADRTITLSGDVTGSGTLETGTNLEITTTVSDDSHQHTGSTLSVGTANRAVVSDASKNLTVSSVTDTELGYLSGVTGAIQTQINDKADVTSTVSAVTYDTTNKKITKTINGTTTDVVTVDAIRGDMAAVAGASASANGAKGLVPAPESGDEAKFLRGDGTWASPGEDSNTTYTFTGGQVNKFTVTPSDSTAQDVSITPEATITAGVSNTTGADVTLSGTDGTNAVTYSATHKSYYVTAPGAVGPTEPEVLDFGESFTVPQTTVNETGHVSAITGRELTLPTETVLSKGSTTGEGNAVTDISVSGHQISITKGATFLTSHPEIPTSTDDTDTATPSFGGDFTAISAVTRDTNGHVTKVTTKTVTLPAAATLSIVGTKAGDTGNAVTGLEVNDHAITYRKEQTFVLDNDSRLSDARTPTSHTHGNISDGGALTEKGVVVVTDETTGEICGSSIDPTDLVMTDDSRLSDARTPTSHTHGDISNDGKIGTTADLAIVTTTGGALTTSDLSTSDPSASGNATSYIDTISQSSKGKITVTKKTIPAADASTAGITKLYNATGTNTDGAITQGAVNTALSGKLDTTLKGAVSGLAELDAEGKVPASQLPSYVDDVIEAYIVGSTPLANDWLSLTAEGSALTPETGKVYVIMSSGDYQNKTYRWGGSTYVVIGNDLALGETSTTAYRGDRGATAYTHSQTAAVHVPTAAATGKVLRSVASDVSVWDDETALSKGTTSGSGNAVTDISVSGHEITLTKGSTFVLDNDSRLSDARTPTSHTHGNISDDGKLSTNGVIVVTNDSTGAIEAGSIDPDNIVLTNDSRLSDARTPTSHTHGNLANDGGLQTTDVTIGSGDKLVITDSSDSDKVARASAEFDGTTTSKALSQAGTFETFLQTHQDISGKLDVTAGVTAVSFDDTNKKITRTINSTSNDVLTFAAGSDIVLTASNGLLTISCDAAVNSRVDVTLDDTNRTYLIGTIETPTSTATARSTVANTAVYATAGTLTMNDIAITATKTQNYIFAAPSAANGAPGFRAMDASDLPTSGVTAGSYGPSADATPSFGGTFSVPYITVDTYGRATAASTKTITVPSDVWGTHVQSGTTQPSNQSTGDLWFQTITS